jgi:phosphonate transport system substrate-binding protein
MGKAILFAAVLGTASLFKLEQTIAEPGKILFGVTPQQSASRLAESWSPLIKRLKAQTGLDIRFATAATITAFEACLEAGAFDLAYMNPLHYVLLSEGGRYRALVRESEPLQGILVARKDSAIDGIGSLKGLDIAFPAAASFGASVLTRAEIEAAHVAIKPHYVQSHDSVYHAVANGLMPAGGGVMRTFNGLPGEIRDRLKIVHTTAFYTPLPIAASSKVDAATAQKIADALLSLHETSAAVLEPLGIRRFQRALASDWDDIRKLNIPKSQSGIADRTQQCPFD